MGDAGHMSTTAAMELETRPVQQKGALLTADHDLIATITIWWPHSTLTILHCVLRRHGHFGMKSGINVMYVEVMYVQSLICTSLLLLIIIDNRCGILVVSLKDIGYRVKPALHLCIV